MQKQQPTSGGAAAAAAGIHFGSAPHAASVRLIDPLHGRRRHVRRNRPGRLGRFAARALAAQTPGVRNHRGALVVALCARSRRAALPGTVGAVARVARVAGGALLGAAAGTIAALAAVESADRRRIARLERQLASTAGIAVGNFSPEMVARLPEPARRYFLHAINPDTPLASTVRLVQSGAIRQSPGGAWLPFSATQLLTTQGFVWHARLRIGPAAVIATDHYVNGQGRMRVTLMGLLPIVNERGPHLSRSAVGRFVPERMWLPSALLPQAGARIEPVDADHFRAADVDGETTTMTLAVDGEGRLREIAFQRFGNITPNKRYQYIPFGGPLDAEGVFGGYTIPTQIRAAWWYGTERQQDTFRITIEDAQFE